MVRFTGSVSGEVGANPTLSRNCDPSRARRWHGESEHRWLACTYLSTLRGQATASVRGLRPRTRSPSAVP